MGIDRFIRRHKGWLFPLAAIGLGLAAVPLVFGVLTGPVWALGLAALVLVGIVVATQRTRAA